VVSVDWRGISDLKREMDFGRGRNSTFDPLFENLLDYLVQSNVLTFSIENSWTLIGGGFELSPKKPAPYPQLYFVRKEDAEAYKDAFYRNHFSLIFVKPVREIV